MYAKFQNSSIFSNKLTSMNVALSWNKIFIAIILYVITCVTIVGNVFVLIAVKINKKLQTTFNYYLVNLAITDIAVAVTAMTFMAVHTVLGYWPFGETLCAFWIFFDYGMTFVSVFTLNLISVERFWSVKWSIHYKRHHTKRKCVFSIVFVWMFMLVLWVPPWLTDRLTNNKPEECFWDPSLNKEFVFIIALFGHHFPFCIMMTCYIYVFLFMRRRSKLMNSNRFQSKPVESNARIQNCESARHKTSSPVSTHESKDIQEKEATMNDFSYSNLNCTNNQATVIVYRAVVFFQNGVHKDRLESKITRDQKVFVTLTYIIVGYSLLWLPFHIVFDIGIVYPGLISKEVLNIFFWMTYFNSTINPILYNFSSYEFRKTFWKILIRCSCCK